MVALQRIYASKSSTELEKATITSVSGSSAGTLGAPSGGALALRAARMAAGAAAALELQADRSEQKLRRSEDALALARSQAAIQAGKDRAAAADEGASQHGLGGFPGDTDSDSDDPERLQKKAEVLRQMHEEAMRKSQAAAAKYHAQQAIEQAAKEAAENAAQAEKEAEQAETLRLEQAKKEAEEKAAQEAEAKRLAQAKKEAEEKAAQEAEAKRLAQEKKEAEEKAAQEAEAKRLAQAKKEAEDKRGEKYLADAKEKARKAAETREKTLAAKAAAAKASHRPLFPAAKVAPSPGPKQT